MHKLNKYSSVPILPEWIDYLYLRLEDSMRQCRTSIMSNMTEIEIYKLSGNQNIIKDIVSEGLSSNMISINGSNEPSVMLDENTGLNDYLTL